MKLSEVFSSNSANSSLEKNLKEFFVDPPFVLAASNLNPRLPVSVFSGLKGTGKTAMFRALTEFYKLPNIVLKFSPKTNRININDSSLTQVTYSYIVEYEMIMEILNSVKESKQISTVLKKKVNKHIKPFWAGLKQVLGKVLQVNILGCGVAIANQDNCDLVNLYSKVEENKAKDILKEVCDSGLSMRLVIDDPEDIFTSGSSIDPILLGGLWLATARMNDSFPNLRVIILMKTYVFDQIINKIKDLDNFPDSFKKISWNEDTLIELIYKRLVYFTGCNSQTWERILLGENFSRKNADDLYKYLISNIQNGPRDMIRWLYLAAKFAEKQGLDYICIDHLQSTFGKLCEVGLQRFSSVYEKYQRINEVLKTIFVNNLLQQFTIEELEKHIERLVFENNKYRTLLDLDWMQNYLPSELIELFFRLGVFIFIKDGLKILPYMKEYSLDAFKNSDKIILAPIFSHSFAEPRK